MLVLLFTVQRTECRVRGHGRHVVGRIERIAAEPIFGDVDFFLGIEIGFRVYVAIQLRMIHVAGKVHVLIAAGIFDGD